MMYFKQIDAIIQGTKMQTRRIAKVGEFHDMAQGIVFTPSVRVKWRVCGDYAVCPGRGKPGVAWNPSCLPASVWMCPGHGNVHESGQVPDSADDLWRPLRIRITAIRMEQLQDISEEDAVAEGCEAICCPECGGRGWRHGFGLMDDPNAPGELIPYPTQEPCEICYGRGWIEPPSEAYAELWDSINTRPGTRWADNPFVWVITFEVVRDA